MEDALLKKAVFFYGLEWSFHLPIYCQGLHGEDILVLVLINLNNKGTFFFSFCGLSLWDFYHERF